jgi:hypothetical protein
MHQHGIMFPVVADISDRTAILGQCEQFTFIARQAIPVQLENPLPFSLPHPQRQPIERSAAGQGGQRPDGQ